MEDITNEEKQFLDQNKIQTFRVYHVRTLAAILKLIKSKKVKDAEDYIKQEMYSITKIKNKEFAHLMDALTLQLRLKGNKNDKIDSGA